MKTNSIQMTNCIPASVKFAINWYNFQVAYIGIVPPVYYYAVSRKVGAKQNDPNSHSLKSLSKWTSDTPLDLIE